MSGVIYATSEYHPKVDCSPSYAALDGDSADH